MYKYFTFAFIAFMSLGAVLLMCSEKLYMIAAFLGAGLFAMAALLTREDAITSNDDADYQKGLNDGLSGVSKPQGRSEAYNDGLSDGLKRVSKDTIIMQS